MPKKGRTNRVGGKRSMTKVRNTPSTNAPETFVQNVAHGNVPGVTGMSCAIS